MLRWRPDLKAEKRPERRDWIVLFESSADRDPLLARVQADVVRTILENAERDDTVRVVAAGARARAEQVAMPLAPENVQAAVRLMENSQLIGALDLEQGFAEAARLAGGAERPVVLHVGSGVPVLGERDGVTQANLQVDTTQDAALDRRLKELPMVAAVMRPRSLLASFDRQTGGTMWVTTLILTLFGATISVGIVYNNARIALSTRSRDLATLRVLGFTRGEISAILLGEMAAYVALAIPVGLVLGDLLMQAVMQSSQTETFRFPSYVSPRSYAFATVVTLVAAVASGLLVRRRLDHLDLIGVLKARE